MSILKTARNYSLLIGLPVGALAYAASDPFSTKKMEAKYQDQGASLNGILAQSTEQAAKRDWSEATNPDSGMQKWLQERGVDLNEVTTYEKYSKQLQNARYKSSLDEAIQGSSLDLAYLFSLKELEERKFPDKEFLKFFQTYIQERKYANEVYYHIAANYFKPNQTVPLSQWITSKKNDSKTNLTTGLLTAYKALTEAENAYDLLQKSRQDQGRDRTVASIHRP